MITGQGREGAAKKKKVLSNVRFSLKIYISVLFFCLSRIEIEFVTIINVCHIDWSVAFVKRTLVQLKSQKTTDDSSPRLFNVI